MTSRHSFSFVCFESVLKLQCTRILQFSQLLSNTQRVIRNQGRRLVTAQLDGNIKFYCRSGDISYHHTPLLNLIRIITTNPLLILAATANAGTWAEEDDKKSVAPRSAHAAPVNRVSWAHPEFGQIVASCSNDKTVRCVVLRRNNRGGGVIFSNFQLGY